MIPKAFCVLLTILAAPPAVSLALYVIFRKHMCPTVFITQEYEAYGIRKPHWSRNFIASVVVSYSAVLESMQFLWYIITRKADKTTKPWLYQRQEVDIWLMDPVSLVGPNGEKPATTSMIAYMGSRAVTCQSIIAKSGWRSVYLRHLIEMPSHESRPEGTVDQGGKTIKVPATRLTKLILY